MEYISVKEAAQKWGVTVRWVQQLCRQGKIPGAKQWERTWMLPENAAMPGQAAANQSKAVLLPRKSPFLDMTDLYSRPGSAKECIAALEGQPEAQALFAAEIAYSQGNIEQVYQQASFFLSEHDGRFAIISGGMLLGLCAMWLGDYALFRKAKMHICEAPCSNEVDESILQLSLAATDLAIRDTRDFPDWFFQGDFSCLPADAHPAARVYYVKYLLIYAQKLAMDQIQLDGVKGLGLMRILPHIIEPMVCQCSVEGTLMAELYLRLLAAIVYQQLGDLPRATDHLDKAIALALPDMLLGTLTEHRRQLGYLLDERLGLADPEALKQMKLLHKKLHAGWVKLHNTVLEKQVSNTLSVREREVARLAAYGYSDAQIAEHLQVSKATVKSLISMAKNKTGAMKRAELVSFI